MTRFEHEPLALRHPRAHVAPQPLRAAVFSADGASLWCLDALGGLARYGADDGVERERLAPSDPTGTRGGWALARSCDGSQLAVAPGNGPAELWSVATGARTALEEKGAAFDAAFDAEGARLLVAGAKNVSLWSLAVSSAPLRSALRAHRSHAYACALTRDGAHAITVSSDELKRHDLRTRKAHAIALDTRWSSGRSALRDDGALLLDAGPDAVVAWDLEREREALRLPLEHGAWRVAGVAGREALLLDVASGALRRLALPSAGEGAALGPAIELEARGFGWLSVQRACGDGAGRWALLGATHDVPHGPGALVLLDANDALRGPEPGASAVTAVHAHGRRVWALAADRSRCAYALDEPGAPTRALRSELRRLDALYDDATGAPALLRASRSDGRAVLLRADDLTLAHAVAGPVPFALRSTVDARARVLYAVDERVELVARGLDDDDERARFAGAMGRAEQVLVSRDGGTVVVLEQASAAVFDARTGAPKARFAVTALGWRGAAALSDDGARFAAPLGKGRHGVWDTATGTLVRTLAPKPLDADPTLQTSALALDATGDRLCTAHAGAAGRGELWLWELTSAAPVAVRSTAPYGAPTAVALTGDAAVLVAGTRTGALLCWERPFARDA